MSTFQLTRESSVSSLRRHAANLITGGRVLLLFLVTAFAVSGVFWLAAAAVPLAIAVVVMDWLDGVAARRWGCESRLGGLLDIVGDRVAENVWWVLFAWLHLIPLWVPVVVLTRGFVVDSLRSYALSKGLTAFGSATMMRSRVGYWLVASRVSRATYGVVKGLAFSALFGLNAVRLAVVPGHPADAALGVLALAATGLTVALCVVRALPVAIDFRRLLIDDRSA